MENQENDLLYWENTLQTEGIDYEKLGNSLIAKLDKRDEEGHHYYHLRLETTNSGAIVGTISGMGDIKHNLSPSDAISDFKAMEIVCF